jgi:hypothetical protein
VTEAEWLTATKVTLPVLHWLRRRGSERQFYLAAAAFVRRVEQRLEDPRCHDLLRLVEEFADGRAAREQLARARRGLENELYERQTALEPEGLSLSLASKRLGPYFAAVWVAEPSGAWEALCNAQEAAGRGGKRAETGPRHVALLHDIFGNPFRPVTVDPAWLAWHGGAVKRLAEAVYDERQLPGGHLDAARLAVLADMLEEAGCSDPDLLSHLRSPGPHVRGCWPLDAILGKG